jgi:uncharacterized cupin superfamily protein
MAQQDGKWIKNDTIKDNHIQLTNDQYMRGRNNADTLDISILKVRTDDKVEFGTQPQFTGAPTIDDDLVNRGYVLDVLAGLRDPKDAVQLATTANVALTGEQTIDGVLTSATRILVKNQTDPIENGIYDTAAGAWTRATDADTNAEVTNGMSCLVTGGNTNARKLYVLTTAAPDVGVNGLIFAQAPNPANFLVPKSVPFTLVALDILNGYIDLAQDAEPESIIVTPIGGPQQHNGIDFTISTVSNVSRITFAGDLATRVAAGDILQVKYSYATA